ncbi:MAG: VWA domain-containing protein [Planctomycetota bacterium]|nr:VWA domain-containing protein [Planctomycetota bacterium]
MNSLLLLHFFLILLPVLGGPSDSLALFRRWRNSPSPELRVQAARSLRGRSDPASRAALLSLLDDRVAAVRSAVRAELVARSPAEGPALARDVAALGSRRARVAGLRAILARKEDPSLFVDDDDEEVRARAFFSGRVAPRLLNPALKDRSGRVRALALEAAGDPDVLANDRAEEVRIARARIARDPGALVPLVADRSWRVRLGAVRAAQRLRSKKLIPPLIGLVSRETGRVAARAGAVLEDLTGAGYGTDGARWKRWWKRNGAAVEIRPPSRKPTHSGTVATITFKRIPVVSRRLCFVLDASRSMDKPAPGAKGKTRWELVRADLMAVLSKLPKKSRFNVILFRTTVEEWRKSLTAATPSAVRRCAQWIEEAKPSGWTNLFDAVALALSDDELDTLYILTDGVPSRGAETKRRAILDEIAFLNRYKLVQINCVQAGSEEGLGKRWRGFLDELARAHDGVSVRE